MEKLELDDVNIMEEIEMKDVLEKDQEVEIDKTKDLSEVVTRIGKVLEEVGLKKLKTREIH